MFGRAPVIGTDQTRRTSFPLTTTSVTMAKVDLSPQAKRLKTIIVSLPILVAASGAYQFLSSMQLLCISHPRAPCQWCTTSGKFWANLKGRFQSHSRIPPLPHSPAPPHNPTKRRSLPELLAAWAVCLFLESIRVVQPSILGPHEIMERRIRNAGSGLEMKGVGSCSLRRFTA